MSHPLHDHDGRLQWGVSRGECGTYRIKLGALLLDLDHAEFLQLVRLLSCAAEHFGEDLHPAPLSTSAAH